MLEDIQLDYLKSTIEQKDTFTQSLEDYARKNDIPIMDPLGMDFVQQMIRIKQPKRIVEIGTAIGYSAIQMARSFENAMITTIERDKTRYNEAIQNIEQAGLTHRIQVIFGDALEVLEDIEQYGPFDVLFIDAAKGQYQRFFEGYTTYLNSEGIVLSDNVLFKGYVADNPNDGSNKAKIANKIRAYNEWLTEHPDYKTTILPIGDGVAVSVKR
ncbi:O-methyltransferase [Pontibacillus yanchengensis]|uniref:tRNA 5-hydroxyuridine methyltransferase n=1 Tax=Pontibacillus yanchengensis Y32 TaxID=1385514 RepID=A0A0A2T934_9BACI|nr:O-methyltransferase [Pontibacillus yanchengensis]KGP70903.1 SAM-dependent methyltransferase [Pontibacillus yanchengensis Y32]